jgi:hypothetical protein
MDIVCTNMYQKRALGTARFVFEPTTAEAAFNKSDKDAPVKFVVLPGHIF